MPFIPHTPNDVTAMLETLALDNINNLFDEIPDNLLVKDLDALPDGLNELAVTQLMQARAAEDGQASCFIGAGAYAHHIPAAVWEVASRGEFMTAYTPYQAEASQGTLQLIYEYQTMMTRLTAMEVSNASLYDGASALAESVLMAVRANRKNKSLNILVPKTLHPYYRRVLDTMVTKQGINLVDVLYDTETGNINLKQLEQTSPDTFTVLIIPQPNFFGRLEAVNQLTDWAHTHNAFVIAVVNPTALALLKPPGEWGQNGADIVCGEGQPLGVPLASGGPYFGFMTSKMAYVRNMPGRIVGRTVDTDGKSGFTLTLQAREQHIRRAKATSNICTNQGLLVTAATIYMSLLGDVGLQAVAQHSHLNTKKLITALTSLPGVEKVFIGECFHEAAIKLPISAEKVLQQLAECNIQGGFLLEPEYPELKNCILVCATEITTEQDVEFYQTTLNKILQDN